jgi:hypothetical protein
MFCSLYKIQTAATQKKTINIDLLKRKLVVRPSLRFMTGQVFSCIVIKTYGIVNI